MLYSKKIYKGIFKKVLLFLVLVFIILSALYGYLYYAVDINRANKNLDIVYDEFSMVDKALNKFLIDEEKEIENALSNEKVTKDLVNRYYGLSNELGVSFQIDFYPDNGKDFSLSKKKKDYRAFKPYQDYLENNKGNILKTTIKKADQITYILRKTYKSGTAVIYVPAENITRKIGLRARDFYIKDKFGKVIFNDSSLVRYNLDRLNKLRPDYLDKGSYIEKKKTYEDYEIHALVARTISNDEFILIFTLLSLAGITVLLILLISIRGFIEEATSVIDELNNQIDMVAEGKLEKLNIKTDDEINSIVKNVNNLIDSKKILLDKNVRLKYINKYNEFKMLESQFNPHFLYNTLELISITMYIDPKISDRIIQDLNEILRYSINDMSFLRFDEDILYIYKFLDIEKIKSEENFTYEIDMDDESGEVLVPKLFLQPILENSLKYARKSRSKLDLKIDIKHNDKNLLIRVRDNGRELSQAEINKLNHYLEIESQKDYISMKHHGLINTYNRLRLLYKDKVSLAFVPVDCGVVIEIRIGL